MNWLTKLNPFAKKPEVNRLDGWVNPVTGLGVAGSDKAVSAYFVRDCRLTDRELSDLYHFDDICIKIVRLRPEEMFRVGYNITVREDDNDAEDATKPGDKKPKPLLKKEDAAADDEPAKAPESPDDEEDPGDQLRKAARKLDLDGKLLEAMCLGRAYGGGLLFCGFADGRTPDLPLNEDAPGELKFLTIFDRRELIVHEWYADPLAPNFGEPKSYMLFPRFFYGADGSKRAEGLIVHESRCVRFEGTHADRQERMQLWGWTYSVLQPVYGVVRDFENLFRSMGYMVQDANQSVFKLSGLLEQISSNSKDLTARMQLVENTRAVNRAVLLDADEGEEFMKVPTTFAGIGDITDRFMQRLAAATDIPVSL